MQLWVRSVRSDLGVRRAVGATRVALFGFILRRALLVGVAGVGLGFWCGPVLWDALPTVAPGAAPWTFRAVAPLAILLLGATLTSVLRPAWQASRTPPAHLLQSPEG
jgi:ABC-type antimicrobial peptide transport system permease subunit